MLIETGGLDGNGGVLAGSAGTDKIDRGGEILHVQAYPQLIGQAGIGEVQPHAAALLLHIDADRRVGQVNDDVTFTLLATLEIQAANSRPAGRRRRTAHRCLLTAAPVTVTGLGRGSCRSGCAGIPRRLVGTNQNVQVVTVDAGGIGRKIRQVDDQSRTIIGFHHSQAAGVAQAKFTGAFAQLVLDTRQVDGNPGWLVDGIALGCGRHRLVEGQFEFHPFPGQRGHIETFKVGRKHQRAEQRKHGCE